MLDEAGEVVAAYAYDPFGNVTEMAGEEAAENPWRFSTKPVKEVTGWSYYGFRWYDAELGRRVNRDPIEKAGGVNLYGFVGNDGVNYVDYLGKACIAYRPSSGLLGIFGVRGWAIDGELNTMLAHEQLIFEDGGSPANIGFMGDGTLKEEPSDVYGPCYSSGWNDCVMRKAVTEVDLKPCCLLGELGPTEKYNCQDWAEEVGGKYRELVQDDSVDCECRPTSAETSK